MNDLTRREPLTYESVIKGVTTLAVTHAQIADDATFKAYFVALLGRMSESEWRAVVECAITYKPEHIEYAPRWWTPGMLLALLDVIRAEAAQPTGPKPSEAELQALEALADAEALRP